MMNSRRVARLLAEPGFHPCPLPFLDEPLDETNSECIFHFGLHIKKIASIVPSQRLHAGSNAAVIALPVAPSCRNTLHAVSSEAS